jgi:hypothetical protein
MLDMTYNVSSAKKSPTPHFTYGLVRDVNPSNRSISYSPIVSNVPSNKVGIAIPLSTNFVKLPEPNNIVRIFVGPDIDASIANSVGSNTMYYDPTPVGVWKTVDNNKIDQGLLQAPKDKASNVNAKDIKKSSLGIPHNTPNKPTPSNAGPFPPNGTYIISNPLPSDNSFAIVIGGTPSSSFGAAYMKQQAEKAGIINNKNIIFSNWENPTNSLMNAVKKLNPNATFSSFMGFSKGGENCSVEIGNFPVILFCDPSINLSAITSIKNKPAPIANGNCYMIYNPENWGKLLGDRQRIAGPLMGKNAILTKRGHTKDFPVLFFQTFGNKL